MSTNKTAHLEQAARPLFSRFTPTILLQNLHQFIQMLWWLKFYANMNWVIT